MKAARKQQRAEIKAARQHDIEQNAPRAAVNNPHNNPVQQRAVDFCSGNSPARDVLRTELLHRYFFATPADEHRSAQTFTTTLQFLRGKSIIGDGFVQEAERAVLQPESNNPVQQRYIDFYASGKGFEHDMLWQELKRRGFFSTPASETHSTGVFTKALADLRNNGTLTQDFTVEAVNAVFPPKPMKKLNAIQQRAETFCGPVTGDPLDAEKERLLKELTDMQFWNPATDVTDSADIFEAALRAFPPAFSYEFISKARKEVLRRTGPSGFNDGPSARFEARIKTEPPANEAPYKGSGHFEKMQDPYKPAPNGYLFNKTQQRALNFTSSFNVSNHDLLRHLVLYGFFDPNADESVCQAVVEQMLDTASYRSTRFGSDVRNALLPKPEPDVSTLKGLTDFLEEAKTDKLSPHLTAELLHKALQEKADAQAKRLLRTETP